MRTSLRPGSQQFAELGIASRRWRAGGPWLPGPQDQAIAGCMLEDAGNVSATIGQSGAAVWPIDLWDTAPEIRTSTAPTQASTEGVRLIPCLARSAVAGDGYGRDAPAHWLQPGQSAARRAPQRLSASRWSAQ